MAIQRICKIVGKIVPVPGANMDTDRIIPARFLKCITFDELAGTMFYDERFNTDGSSKRHPIDDPRHSGARIIIGGENFGCGSSREHAPQAIRRSGIRAIIAESFAEIFFGNSSGTGLPCVCAVPEDIVEIQRQTEQEPGTEWTLDLEAMQLSGGGKSYPVTMPEEPRKAFLEGRWDSVTELLEAKEALQILANSLPCPHLTL